MEAHRIDWTCWSIERRALWVVVANAELLLVDSIFMQRSTFREYQNTPSNVCVCIRKYQMACPEWLSISFMVPIVQGLTSPILTPLHSLSILLALIDQSPRALDQARRCINTRSVPCPRMFFLYIIFDVLKQRIRSRHDYPHCYLDPW